MHQKTSYAVIGGDTRQIYLLQKLLEHDESCLSFALHKEEMRNIFRLSAHGYQQCKYAASLSEAIGQAKWILGPIPFSRDGYFNSKERFKVSEFLNPMQSGQTLFAGCLEPSLKTQLEQRGIYCYDYMQAEEISLFNSIATAEGAIAETIINYPYNLHKSKCLVIGYGRCGKTLADKLKGLGADVSICARKAEVLSFADCLGYDGLFLHDLKTQIHKFNLIFNTVPLLILTAELLKKVSAASQIYDLASKPGGVDWIAAKNLRLSARSCLSLPGKYAPAASAEILYRYITQVK